MKKLKFSKTERRIIIVLMSINLFAFFVNYFGMSPKFELDDAYGSYIGEDMAYIFTDVGTTSFPGEVRYLVAKLYNWKNSKNFWPLTDFYFEQNKLLEEKSPYNNSKINKEYYSESRFRGIFADFDHTEFLVYTFMIFGIVLIKKL